LRVPLQRDVLHAIAALVGREAERAMIEIEEIFGVEQVSSRHFRVSAGDVVRVSRMARAGDRIQIGYCIHGSGHHGTGACSACQAAARGAAGGLVAIERILCYSCN
jgi:hypothetical protein